MGCSRDFSERGHRDYHGQLAVQISTSQNLGCSRGSTTGGHRDSTMASLQSRSQPHRTWAVVEVLQQEVIATLPWPACSPDLNPTEHPWDILGRTILQMNPPIPTVAEREAVLHQDWALVMRRRVGDRQCSKHTHPTHVIEWLVKEGMQCFIYGYMASDI